MPAPAATVYGMCNDVNTPIHPHYLVIRVGHESYVLDESGTLMRRSASRMLQSFARTRGRPISLEDARWDRFIDDNGWTQQERKQACLYSLVKGGETRHQLALLAFL